MKESACDECISGVSQSMLEDQLLVCYIAIDYFIKHYHEGINPSAFP